MVQASASPEEAAAIAAAIEQFLRDTTPTPTASEAVSPWLRSGIYENAGLDPLGPPAWGDPERWGPTTPRK